MSEVVKDIVIAEEDLLRADLYDFLAALLANPPDSGLLQRASSLGGDDSALGQAISTLARVAKAMKEPAVEREFNALFIGLGRGELMPFASYYLTGFLNEKPLATLRADMAGLRITRAPNVYEPEDNIASLLEMMAGMIRGRFGEPTPLTRQKDFYFTHIAPWAEHFFTDLEGAQNSVFYAPVGTVGKAFLEIETQAFRMGAE
ncbi:molecular chaperone TorD family protein [Shimia sp. R9_1]|uniref:TorD/DmsD family molecular chaperone n=1 Tax=unclassified Shimia TaxID=2630038 RepID=UPI001ADC624F|nr:MULTISPECIES: molecular chaperone TorD family protein [unclassified Shimia]MBO9395489.1 molecular chaperone TorD family protein [Shimia sp. R9_2]MBO9407493.1 molecular chaperone TorD family protein [Shimia sp. R9_1]